VYCARCECVGQPRVEAERAVARARLSMVRVRESRERLTEEDRYIQTFGILDNIHEHALNPSRVSNYNRLRTASMTSVVLDFPPRSGVVYLPSSKTASTAAFILAAGST
jgi:hypothetical protein